jgi:hypothetical protein
MNDHTLSRCIERTQRLESRPLFRYFSSLPLSPLKIFVRDLVAIKQRLISRGYATVDDWIRDLTDFFSAIQSSKKATLLQRHTAACLAEEIRDFKRDSLIELPSLERWTADWWAAYQGVADHIANAMPEFQLGGVRARCRSWTPTSTSARRRWSR